jgi:predicted transcriptional regulator
MYDKIHILNKKGFNATETGARLQLDPRTVSKYLKMTRKQFKRYKATAYNRSSCFDKWKNEIISIQGKAHRKLSAAAIYDVLEEKYGKLNRSERAFRRYIRNLRERGELKTKCTCRL